MDILQYIFATRAIGKSDRYIATHFAELGRLYVFDLHVYCFQAYPIEM